MGRLAVRRKASDHVEPGTVKAENEAFDIATYRLVQPPPGVDRDAIDKLWSPVESVLPALVDRLTDNRLVPGDVSVLYQYVAMASVRHPSFALVAGEWQKSHGGIAPMGDELQLMRVQALTNQIHVLASWRWRVVHAPEDGPRLMITDRGWVYVGEPDRSDHALFLPLGPRVALLGYLDSPDLPQPKRAPFEEHLDLCWSWVEWFNADAWADPYIGALYCHPSDRALLEQLRDPSQVLVNGYGPYRYRLSGGLTD